MRYTKDAAKTQFERWSRRYDRSILQQILFQPSHETLLTHVQLPSDARVLEVGCGTGGLARRFLKSHPECKLWGVDLSRSMLEQAAHAMNASIALAEGDAERLPFEGGYFDAVLCAHCFHHFPNQPQAIREMHRVLRPGGQVLMLDGDRDRLWGRLVYDVGVVLFEGGVHHASAQRFRDLFHECGFTSVEQFRGGRLAPYLVTRATSRKPSRAQAPARVA